METLTEEQIEEIRATHNGRAVAVDTAAGTAVFRYPTRTEFNRWQGIMLGDNGDAKANAGYTLCVACAVHPDRKTFLEWCEIYAAVPLACIGPITRAAGAEGAAREKKSEG